jgi:hypothetical protein
LYQSVDDSRLAGSAGEARVNDNEFCASLAKFSLPGLFNIKASSLFLTTEQSSKRPKIYFYDFVIMNTAYELRKIRGHQWS